MKIPLTIIGLVFCLFCNGQRSASNTDFQELRERLLLIKTPVELPTHFDRLERLPDNKILLGLQAKYSKRQLPFIVLGRLFDSHKFVALLGVVPAGPGSYIIITFNKEGEQIDSLAVLPNHSGYVIDSISSDEFRCSAKVFSRKQIVAVDSSVSYDVRMEQGIPIEVQQTKTVSVQTRRYRITKKGKILIVD